MTKLRNALVALALVAVGLFAAATPASASVHPNSPCKIYTAQAGNPIHWVNGLGNGPGSGVFSYGTTPNMYAGPTGDVCTGIAVSGLQWPDGLAHHTSVGVAYEDSSGSYVWQGTWYDVLSNTGGTTTVDSGTPRGKPFKILIEWHNQPWENSGAPTVAVIHC